MQVLRVRTRPVSRDRRIWLGLAALVVASGCGGDDRSSSGPMPTDREHEVEAAWTSIPEGDGFLSAEVVPTEGSSYCWTLRAGDETEEAHCVEGSLNRAGVIYTNSGEHSAALAGHYGGPISMFLFHTLRPVVSVEHAEPLSTPFFLEKGDSYALLYSVALVPLPRVDLRITYADGSVATCAASAFDPWCAS